MWQQWFTFIGLAADVGGFCLIAIEWARTFEHNVAYRDAQLEDAYERNDAQEQGREPDCRYQGEEEAMAREFSKLHHSEARLRRSLYVLGLALVIIGFVLQAVGAWPLSKT